MAALLAVLRGDTHRSAANPAALASLDLAFAAFGDPVDNPFLLDNLGFGSD